jgi:hypothetical protein
MIGSPVPEECTARLQLVAGFNRLAAAVVRIQEEARAAHQGPKKQRVLAEAGERFRAGLKVQRSPSSGHNPDTQPVLEDDQHSSNETM